MSHMHEELEVGQHLDQALRSSVTGIAQLMERVNRRAAERDRGAAAAERDLARQAQQQYREAQTAERDQRRRAEMAARDQVYAEKRAMLDERDASRQAYGPWLREGAVERGDRLDVSRAWARAAGWVEQDPRARDAEKILRERIIDAYGVSPAQVLRSVEPGRGNPTGIPAGRISLAEALDLATQYAPHYYGVHTAEAFGRVGKSPINPTQEKFVDDWQRWAAITEASDGQLQGVAPLGTALTDAQADKIAGKIGSDGRVWLALDSDAAGQRQGTKDFWKFTERGIDVRELGFPAGADPAQMWQEQPDVLQGLVAYPDVARSASMAVMDATITEERMGLLTGDEAARERVDLAEGELASVLRNEFDRADLNSHVRSELDRLRAQEAQALQQAEHLDQREDQLRERAVQSLDPHQPEQLEGRAERLENAEQSQRGRAAQLHGQEIAAQGQPTDVDDAADMPYNRAASSDLPQVSPRAARARAVSAHGFSQSTQDALDTGHTAGKQWQPKRTTGTQQQVGRSRGMRR